MPTVTYFDYDTGSGEMSGWIDYDDSQVNAGSSGQFVPITDLDFTWNGVEYSFPDVSLAGIQFQYGQITQFMFSTSLNSQLPFVSVSVHDGTMTVSDNSGTSTHSASIQNYGPQPLDTSDATTGSAFLFTLADGTRGKGEFTMNSADVITSGSGYASLTTFKLTVGGTTYTASDCYSAPQAHFVNGQFVGLSYDIRGITGQSFDQLVGGNGVVTPYLTNIAAQAKKEVYEKSTVDLSLANMTTGKAYNVQVKLYGQGAGQILLGTLNFSVGAGANTNDIVKAFKKQLEKAGIFFQQDPDDASLFTIGGRKDNSNPDNPPRALTKIEFALFTQTQNGNPVPDNTLTGPDYVTGEGTPKVVVKVNGNTISGN